MLILKKFTKFALIIFSGAFLIFAQTPQCQADEDCLGCHDVLSKPFVHEAVMMGCGSCHEPHGVKTSFAKRLKDKGNGLCFQCHEENKILVNGAGHPVSGHPVLGGRDILYPEKKLTCVSCHNPHSSNTRELFRYSYGENTPYKGQRCAVCHYEKLGLPGTIPSRSLPIPAWND
ncbi:MAG TPA: hypothetical protein DCS07_03605 [Bdellovibrionales bacterium]|nr:MAG: hypothetical protein A2Z97_12220 [Bdellovibrionales bacterium GWB1_52_6]OFZ03707.1 MAG: hypothetical protein A2X97_14200 [Bdellovibrionales bacterium GWA1_52_35]OFZ41143.1 MAG: hypothetical protein A2070_08755 [Bdellovibrionales bacterium GWC1_52_8]HAR41704.1 hypothetical protein [Bdellovibrionales bacterium]HCM38781.1 hypothetical protein [Bdellovibrionales bacterium]